MIESSLRLPCNYNCIIIHVNYVGGSHGVHHSTPLKPESSWDDESEPADPHPWRTGSSMDHIVPDPLV